MSTIVATWADWARDTLVQILGAGGNLDQFQLVAAQYNCPQHEIVDAVKWLYEQTQAQAQKQIQLPGAEDTLPQLPASSRPKLPSLEAEDSTDLQIEEPELQKNPASRARKGGKGSPPVEPQREPARAYSALDVPEDRNLTESEIQQKLQDILRVANARKAYAIPVGKGWRHCPRVLEFQIQADLDSESTVEKLANTRRAWIHHAKLPEHTVVVEHPGYLGIQIPQPEWENYSLFNFVKPKINQSHPASSLVAPLGINLDFNLIRSQIDRVLIGGTSGAGKTTLEMAIVSSLMQEWHPQHFQVVFFDFKEAGFKLFNGSPWNWKGLNAITDPEMAKEVLEELAGERERRKNMRSKQQVFDIWNYNSKCPENAVPQILLLFDEIGMARTMCGEDFLDKYLSFELPISRSEGFSYIIGAQRPSRKVLPELVDANLILRIGMHVSEPKESAIILGDGYKEASWLEDKGEMFVRRGGKRMQRLQGLHMNEYDVVSLVQWGQKVYGMKKA